MGPVDVGLLDVVVLLELVGLVDVVVLLELVVLLEEVDDSDVVDGGVVVVGTWLSPTPVRGGKSTVLVPSRAPLMKAVQILTGKVPPVSSPNAGDVLHRLGLAVDVVVDADRGGELGGEPVEPDRLVLGRRAGLAGRGPAERLGARSAVPSVTVWVIASVASMATSWSKATLVCFWAL